MEKENKKEREKHRKAFNEMVRRLVALLAKVVFRLSLESIAISDSYVMSKLDPRVKEHQKRLAAEARKKAQLEEEKREKAAKLVQRSVSKKLSIMTRAR